MKKRHFYLIFLGLIIFIVIFLLFFKDDVKNRMASVKNPFYDMPLDEIMEEDIWKKEAIRRKKLKELECGYFSDEKERVYYTGGGRYMRGSYIPYYLERVKLVYTDTRRKRNVILDEKTFTPIKDINGECYGYRKDKDNVFYSYKNMYGADVETFEVIYGKKRISRDKNGLFAIGDRRSTKDIELERMDVIFEERYKIFEVNATYNLLQRYEKGNEENFLKVDKLEDLKCYAKDSQNIYVIKSNKKGYYLDRMKDVDVDTFELLFDDGENCLSKDKELIYYNDKYLIDSDYDICPNCLDVNSI